MKRLVSLLAAAALLCASAPLKEAPAYDGLRIAGADRQMVGWAALKARDANVRYVYLDVPAMAEDEAYAKASEKLFGSSSGPAEVSDPILEHNLRSALEQGLEVGLCFPFVDTLSRVFIIRAMLTDIPAELNTLAPMIHIPANESMDRRTVHHRLQLWSEVLNKFYSKKPVFNATREVCKGYLAPVLSTNYPICLTHPEGPGMRQYPTPYSGPAASELPDGITAYPLLTETEQPCFLPD